MNYLDLKGGFYVNTELNSITYIITEIEEPITKEVVLQLKEFMGGDFTLHTNAGVELHSSEVVDNTWKGIKVLRN